MQTQNNSIVKTTNSQSILHQSETEIQPFETLRELPIALNTNARAVSCKFLNQILADSIILYSLYKKHHWLMRGATFLQLHELLDKHAQAQLTFIDLMAERVQTLGGVAIADPRHVAELTKIERPPNGVEAVPAMLSRLLKAHEVIIGEIREAAAKVIANGDDGTNDLLVSDVLRGNELQVWFIAEHLVDTPLVRS